MHEFYEVKRQWASRNSDSFWFYIFHTIALLLPPLIVEFFAQQAKPKEPILHPTNSNYRQHIKFAAVL